MIFSVDQGTLYVGYHIAKKLSLEKGDKLEFNDKTFRVVQILSEAGSVEDIKVYGHLSDVQKALGLEGRINEIQALECLCTDPNIDSIDLLREELKNLLPDTKVIQLRAMAKAREKQRIMVQTYMQFIVNALMLGCAIWIAVLTMLNVQSRRTEIGILRAIGFGSLSIALLFLIKVFVIALLASGGGYLLGTWIALQYGEDIFLVTAKSLAPFYPLIWDVMMYTPLAAMVCALFPAIHAILQDPVENLREF